MNLFSRMIHFFTDMYVLYSLLRKPGLTYVPHLTLFSRHISVFFNDGPANFTLFSLVSAKIPLIKNSTTPKQIFRLCTEEVAGMKEGDEALLLSVSGGQKTLCHCHKYSSSHQLLPTHTLHSNNAQTKPIFGRY